MEKNNENGNKREQSECHVSDVSETDLKSSKTHKAIDRNIKILYLLLAIYIILNIILELKKSDII